ncbi:MAG: hypothetical protein D8M59_14715 [Planctomycetes bacterium]|nr:hypothetical protein [Planctomycetota bacterium]NOG53360.1 lysophospholipid acyltransferase family protein [Planctomycetota bacterium]
MAYNDSILTNYSAYAGLRIIGTLLQSFDVDRVMAFVGRLGESWAARDARRRQRAIDSLRLSFPEWTDPEIDSVARRSMRHLLQLFIAEVLFTPRLITPDTWHEYVDLGDIKPGMPHLLSDRPAIFITGHCGNFEVLGFTLGTVGFPMTALARPLDLPKINDWLMGVRQARGMSIMTKFGATERLPRLLEAGGRVAFIADQNAGDKGVFVPFFGRLASAYKSIGLLAMRYEVPIICGQARRTDPTRFRYRIELKDIIQPQDWADQDDPLYYVTARYTNAIERMVRDAPEQYFWVHRRWKSRPAHERAGKPMPKSLARKVASLPWLNDREVDRVISFGRA